MYGSNRSGFSLVLAIGIVLGVACNRSDDEEDGGGGGTTTPSATNVDTTQDTGSSVEGTTSGGTSSACDDSPSPGQSCNAEQEGEDCSYGDDCGGYVVQCQGGTWVQTDGWGCNAPIVECREGPRAGENPDQGDGCSEPGELCDLDGDCMDVLECVGFNWYAFDVCSEVYCETIQPVVAGEACEVDDFERECPGAPPCEAYKYRCHGVNGWSPTTSGVPEECL